MKGPALFPGMYDQQGTQIDGDVIEQAGWDFLRRAVLEPETIKGTGVGEMHTKVSKNQWLVELYLLDRPTEFLTELTPEDVEEDRYPDIRLPLRVEKNADGANTGNVYVEFPEKTLMIATQYAEGNPAWDKIEAGTYNGFSIEGDAWRVDEE